MFTTRGSHTVRSPWLEVGVTPRVRREFDVGPTGDETFRPTPLCSFTRTSDGPRTLKRSLALRRDSPPYPRPVRSVSRTVHVSGFPLRSGHAQHPISGFTVVTVVRTSPLQVLHPRCPVTVLDVYRPFPTSRSRPWVERSEGRSRGTCTGREGAMVQIHPKGVTVSYGLYVESSETGGRSRCGHVS